MNRTDVGEVTALRIFDIGQQRTCGGDRHSQSTTAKAIEIPGLKLSLQSFAGAHCFEAPVGLPPEGAGPFSLSEKARFRHEDLCRSEACDLGFESDCVVDLRYQKSSAADI